MNTSFWQLKVTSSQSFQDMRILNSFFIAKDGSKMSQNVR